MTTDLLLEGDCERRTRRKAGGASQEVGRAASARNLDVCPKGWVFAVGRRHERSIHSDVAISRKIEFQLLGLYPDDYRPRFSCWFLVRTDYVVGPKRAI